MKVLRAIPAVVKAAAAKWEVQAFNPELWRQRQVGRCEFQGSLPAPAANVRLVRLPRETLTQKTNKQTKAAAKRSKTGEENVCVWLSRYTSDKNGA